jgi:RecA-family ATPase
MLNLKSADELHKRESKSPFILEQLLLDDAIVLVAGLPKTRKSYLLADVAVSIATGTPSLGCYNPNKKGNVIYLQGEDSEEIISERLNDIALSRGLSRNSLSPIKVATCTDLRLDNQDHLAELERHIVSLNAAAVICDPIARLIDCPDTARAPMKRLLTSLRMLQSRTKTCLVLATHLSKHAKDGDLSAIAGSGDLRSAYSQAILMSKPVPHITRGTHDCKSIGCLPDLFFELRSVNGYLAPVALGLKDTEREAS